MSTVAPSVFLPYVLPYVPGCPDVAAEDEIVRSAIRFCELSGCWQEMASAQNIVLSTHTYTVPAPANAQCDCVDEVWVNGVHILPANTNELRLFYTDWTTATGAAAYHTQQNQDEVRIVPIPTANITNGLKIRATYKPVPGATTLPAILYQNFAQGVAAGALARLYATKNKAWSDPDAADKAVALFTAEAEAARVKANKSFNHSRLAPE